MDRYDDPVELTVFLKENSGLHKFFQPIIDEKIESNPSLFVLLSNPTEEQIAEGMRVGTNYNFEYKEGRGVVQEVSLYKLLAEGDLDDEVRTFLEELYEGDSTVKSDAWTAIIKNEKIRSFIEKYITENDEEVEALKEETIPAFLRDYHKDIYGDIEDKMVEYGNLPEETINKVEDIIGYKIEDIKHGHIFIDFDYWGEVDAIGSDISNLNYMAEDNIRNYSIYIQDEEDENYIKNLANTYKDQLEDEDDFLADVKRILIKHKHSLTDKRNNQIKLNLGNEEE
jgi:hypothetical protein